MAACRSCSRSLEDGLLYLDATGRPVQDQSSAAWKTCPRCSELARQHIYLQFPTAFGTTKRRITDENPVGVHSWCTYHRNELNKDSRNPAPNRTCGEPPARDAVQARPPVARRAPKGLVPGEPDVDLPLSADQLDAVAAAQVGWFKLSEEGCRFLRTHVDTERNPGNRHAIIRLRRANGALTCDGCDVDLAAEYGEEHQTVLELHHLRPLARGVQKPKGTDDFALLCPTCHRVVHYRREDPLRIDELRELLASRE
jgi:hypothetical protein